MPTRPKTKALEEALEKLQAAREAFAQAFDGILSQLDMSPIEGALADWRQAAEAFREEAQRVHGDASTYYDDRSEHWQDSEKGQAFYIWVTTLEELADFDPEPVDTVRIAIDLSGGGRLRTWKVTQVMPCRSCQTCRSWRSKSVESQMHQVDLRYTKEELLTIFAIATKEDVDLGGHYNCQGVGRSMSGRTLEQCRSTV